jgi:hypothetical protein
MCSGVVRNFLCGVQMNIFGQKRPLSLTFLWITSQNSTLFTAKQSRVGVQMPHCTPLVTLLNKCHIGQQRLKFDLFVSINRLLLITWSWVHDSHLLTNFKFWKKWELIWSVNKIFYGCLFTPPTSTSFATVWFYFIALFLQLINSCCCCCCCCCCCWSVSSSYGETVMRTLMAGAKEDLLNGRTEKLRSFIDKTVFAFSGVVSPSHYRRYK